MCKMWRTSNQSLGGMQKKKALLYILIALGVVYHAKGERLNDHISYYEPLNLVASSTASNQHKMVAKFNFAAFGRVFELNLKTHPSLFHPDFHVVVVGKERARQKKMIMKHFVTGNVEGEQGSLVYGRVLDGSFDGVIHSRGESYHIEPLSHHPQVSTHPQAHNRLIYRASDVDYDKILGNCRSGNSSRLNFIQKSATAHNLDQQIPNSLRKKRQSDNLNTCTIKIVADNRFYEDVGGSSEKNTLDEMVLHILDADNTYRMNPFNGNGRQITSRLSIHSSMIFTGEDSSDPFLGDFSVEELLEAFSEENFDDVCLGHLFTYRDYQGTIGLAYLGDPNGRLAGGICQKRTRTAVGDVNLNTGLTSLLNFGVKLSRAVSFITVAHEIGHNHGAGHDPPGECFDGRYIMYPYATAGNKKEFSECSKSSIGQTIENRGSCFIPYPSGAECGNGIVEKDEDCDCGETENQSDCDLVDPCCLVNCTLKPEAACSAKASTCCDGDLCQPLNDTGFLCLKGDIELDDAGCQEDTYCELYKADCPAPTVKANGTSCNNGTNVCENGACTGSPCSLFEGQPNPCYCEAEEEQCHVCCMFSGKCTSTFDLGRGIYVAPNYPCSNFTGYCTEEHVCKDVNNDDILNRLRDILLDFTSIWNWVKGNWYWVLGGFAAVVILIILLQVTYRRKKLSKDVRPAQQKRRWGIGKRRRLRRSGVGGSRENVESSLLTGQTRT